MNPSPFLQTAGNVCVAFAALTLFLPVQRLLGSYSSQYVNHDQWVTPALFALVPLWLLLLLALLCATASGGFDWLHLGRPVLHGLTVAASLALAVVSFLLVAFYIRPGFTPRSLYLPGIYLLPLATMVLVVLSLQPKLAPAGVMPWLRWPWTVFAGLSLLACTLFFGQRLVHMGCAGVAELVHRVGTARERQVEHLARIPDLDPLDEAGFAALLELAEAHHGRETRAAATARLRTVPDFIPRLAALLVGASGSSAGLGFLPGATLTAAECEQLAVPARTAMEAFLEGIPAPNYMSPERRKQLLQWGRRTLPEIVGKFAGTNVDFSRILPDFEHRLRPDDTRR
jgi:hypothetical protein